MWKWKVSRRFESSDVLVIDDVEELLTLSTPPPCQAHTLHLGLGVLTLLACSTAA